MAGTREYEVLRHHEGDQTYRRGDTREALPVDVAHLVEAGFLREKRAAKAEPPVLNKAEPAPANKADVGARAGRRG